jgi:DNA mismatch repair protein MutS2
LAVDREEEVESLRRKQEDLERERAELRRRHREEMDRLAAEVRSLSRKILEEWKQGRVSRKKALRELGEQKRRLAGAAEGESGQISSEEAPWDSLQPGQAVAYPKWRKNGVILDKDLKSRKLKVDLGGVTVWLSAEDVSPLRQNTGQEAQPAAQAVTGSGGSFRVDLRGQRADEAESMLYRSLDRAILQGRKHLEIIHGRGTGALRQTVHELLRTFSAVESYVLAPEDRGGDGVTLVELKG